MIEKLAMSEELGLQHFSGKDQISDATQLKIDLEVDKILNESYKRAIDILRTHRIELTNLAEADRAPAFHFQSRWQLAASFYSLDISFSQSQIVDWPLHLGRLEGCSLRSHCLGSGSLA